MPKITYTPKTFTAVHRAIVEQANDIIDTYRAQGYDLTLRQLYYQFVAREIFPPEWADPQTGSTNNVRSYKKLGSIVSDARRAGLIDWEAIIDRTRNLRSQAFWSGPASIVSSCASQFDVDFWARQDTRCEVWVEKDALVGVMEAACDPLQVPYFSCRGYTSDSEVWGAAQRLRGYGRKGFKVVVLHLGDHDPSGIDMSRDIADRLDLFGAGDVEVRRIALNMDQVEEYDPPPNPAKETDSRYAGYRDLHGDESWELDALNPDTLAGLIRENVEAMIDKAAWSDAEAARDEGRAALAAIAGNWAAVHKFLEKKNLLGDE